MYSFPLSYRQSQLLAVFILSLISLSVFELLQRPGLESPRTPESLPQPADPLLESEQNQGHLTPHSRRRRHLHHHNLHHEGLHGHANHSLIKRDDYSCSKANPCANGACCGASGYCGYGRSCSGMSTYFAYCYIGPTYCGTGCLSQCNAVAECGKYAKPAGKTCPLNTW